MSCDEIKIAVLNQSMMNEARSKERLERINDIIEDYILKNDLKKDNIFCKLNKEIFYMITDIELDITIHKQELQQIKKKKTME